MTTTMTITKTDLIKAAPTFATVVKLCRQFTERERALRLTPKKADAAALEFIVGCHCGAAAAGDAALAQHLEKIVYLTSIRGAFELRRIASDLTVA